MIFSLSRHRDIFSDSLELSIYSTRIESRNAGRINSIPVIVEENAQKNARAEGGQTAEGKEDDRKEIAERVYGISNETTAMEAPQHARTWPVGCGHSSI
jgi:hypothetical protein